MSLRFVKVAFSVLRRPNILLAQCTAKKFYKLEKTSIEVAPITSAQNAREIENEVPLLLIYSSKFRCVLVSPVCVPAKDKYRLSLIDPCGGIVLQTVIIV